MKFALSIALAAGTAALAFHISNDPVSKAEAKKMVAGPMIEGTIHFKGKAPSSKKVDASSDAFCAKGKIVPDEVTVKGGKLKDVHVRIKNGTAGKWEAPSSPVVIVQDGCVYSPHMVGAVEGQKVVIKNKDATMHNVHAYSAGESWFNRSQPKGAAPIVEDDIGEGGTVFELKCNVHPWMHSYIPITDHPFFSVSDDKGQFRFEAPKPGSYTIEAYHPKFGTKKKTIKIEGRETKVDFQFP